MNNRDHSFRSVGAKPGIEIWMIKEQEVVRQPKPSFGDFISCNSYIVVVTKRENLRCQWDIHFWIGKDTSKEDAVIAVLKTLELDELLGGGTTQYREVEGNESKEFRRLFPSWIRYFCKGLDKSKKEAGKIFYHVKGKRHIRLAQVEPDCNSMNKRDVFILDDGFSIFCWNGSQSSKVQRAKAVDAARRIRDNEKGGLAQIILIDEELAPNNEDTFFERLGGKEQTKCSIECAVDELYSSKYDGKALLYKVLEEDGDISIEETGYEMLTRDILNSEDCFMLDTRQNAIFTWVGMNCAKNLKKSAMSIALEFINTRNYPFGTQVTRVLEGMETNTFRRYFEIWKDEVDASGLSPELRRCHAFENSCTNETEIWLVTPEYHKKLDSSTHGVLFNGDCYVIQYKYGENNKSEKFILYCWQGLKSSKDARDASRNLAKKIDHEAGGNGILIEIAQGTETRHFLSMFARKMIVRQGNSKDGIEGRHLSSGMTINSGACRLFHIQGKEHWSVRLIQVEVSASKLDSGGVFLLEQNSISFVWEGKEVNDEDKDVAEKFAFEFVSNGDLVVIQEGFETDEFWQLLGGKSQYSSSTRSKVAKTKKNARLYLYSSTSNDPCFIEIRDFEQSDLCEDDIVILEAKNEIFIWLGKWTSATEREEAYRQATISFNSFEINDEWNRRAVIEVKQELEPMRFTTYFPTWENRLSIGTKSYEATKSEILMENDIAAKSLADNAKYDTVYSYAELRKASKIQGLDICSKERYLADAEFQRVFGMSKVQFYKQPLWKQVRLKKQMGLY